MGMACIIKRIKSVDKELTSGEDNRCPLHFYIGSLVEIGKSALNMVK